MTTPGQLARKAEWAPRRQKWTGGIGPGALVSWSVKGAAMALLEIEHIHLSNFWLKPAVGSRFAAGARPRSPTAA
jgi:hypothetical protein